MELDRRTFLDTAAAGLAATVAGCASRPGAAPAAALPRRLDTVRVGFVGLGHQGTSHVENFLRIEGVEIRALCDIVPAKVTHAQELLAAAGRAPAAEFTRGPRDFERLCATAELDLVFTATPWELHAPVCLSAMQHDKHAATEVPMAPTLDECWQLVETSERTGRHCVMMENCCYDRAEMMILNMVRQGVLGELLHAECGYLHDLRELKLTDFYEGRWRVAHSIRRNGDLYPTHGLGPVAQWLDVNRGNQFEYLVSVGSGARGLSGWAAEHLGPASPAAQQRYLLSDVVTTIVRTRREQTIVITHDTNLPRPYSRNIVLQGTRGVVRKYPEAKIHVEGRSRAHQWEDLATYREQFEHPVWKVLEERSRGAGHGGMDFIEDYRLVQCLRSGEPTDMDVYDGAAWSAVSELSERSIQGRGRPVDFPDFTRGAWRGREPLGIVTVQG